MCIFNRLTPWAGYWNFVSGLTCDEQVFINKSGAQMAAAQHGIILVGPDTSPRGKLLNIHILSPLFAILSFAIFY